MLNDKKPAISNDAISQLQQTWIDAIDRAPIDFVRWIWVAPVWMAWRCSPWR